MGPKTLSVMKKHALPAPVVAGAFLRALQCAREFEGATAPNPPVGCVVLDKFGKQLAIAAHKKAGALHAEALAIKQCRQQGTFGQIHTLVVTLEPCNHTGRTPACTEAILATPAHQIWFGVKDPNPKVAGMGAKRIAASGIKIGSIDQLDNPDALELARQAFRLIAPFSKLARTGLPWLAIKQAINRAGTMIPEAGGKTFTSPGSLVYAHTLRKRADAILTGSGTILADSPQFTVRHVADFKGKRRHLVIMDRRGRVSDSYLGAARQAGFDVYRQTSLGDALARLGRAGVLKVLLEAGPTLLEAVLESKFWDEHITISQQWSTGQDDRISICYRSAIDHSMAGKEEHVFRDY